MKKLLQSWKLWTGLSILVFIMTCWLLIYAASSRNFASFKTTTMWNTLTSQNWNNLMDSLNEYTVPQWAVMAFNLPKCPDWWTRFTDAEGRFIMGDSTNSKRKWWNFTIRLWVSQLPKHRFPIRIWWRGNDGENKAGNVIRIWDSKPGPRGENKETTAYTDYVGNWDPIDITNPYITLLYCQKM